MSREDRGWFSLVAVAAISFMAVVSVSGGIPQKINYQGRLTDGVTGEPEVGSHDMVFRIYDDPSVGTVLWSESRTLQADSAGIFSVILGSMIPIDTHFDEPIWLEVEVGGEVLSPRREIVSVPFAFRSQVADSAEHAEQADHAGDADSLGGLSSGSYSLVGHVHTEYVGKDELGSITGEMITDGEITDDDIAPEAGIDPAKISGGAWTSANDGAGSGLDADMIDGLHADAFSDTGHDHNELYFTKDELHMPGMLNDPVNPAHWTKLTGVPDGFADGIDNAGAGDGHSLDATDGDPVDQVYVDDDGNVGIGMTSPEMRFDVTGGISRLQQGLIVGPATYGVSGIHIYDDDTGPSLRLTDASGTGNAFISLVDGTAYDWSWSLRGGEGFAITDDKATEWRFFINPSGDVGVGTTDPQRRLHIVGENPRILIEASSLNPEVNFLGSGDAVSDIWAIYKDHSTDDLRFFQWGDKVTIQDSTGNVGIGTAAPAVKLDVNGDIDADSLYKIGGETVLSASGPGNVRLGIHAGKTNGGKWTTLVGDSAGFSTSGPSNTFVGYLSGFRNSSGSGNTFVGAEAGYSNSFAGGNTYVGSKAGHENQHGGGNTFVGGSAGYFNKGGNNTFVGLYAGLDNDSGDENTFVGGPAGSGNISGNQNTYLGRNAGALNETGSGNVCIGYKAGFNEMGSDNLYIANGSGDEDVLIYGNFSNGRIGLGTTDPQRKLHLVGSNPRILIEASSISPEVNFKHSGDGDSDVWAIYKEDGTENLYFYQGANKIWIRGVTGNVGIGADPGNDKLRVQGSACATGGWNSCSDLGFKEDIETIGHALDAVMRLRGVSFSWKANEYGDMGLPDGRHFGVVAQEVEKVLPQVVIEGPAGVKAVAYDEIIPVLIEAIKAQQDQIEVLEARLSYLEK